MTQPYDLALLEPKIELILLAQTTLSFFVIELVSKDEIISLFKITDSKFVLFVIIFFAFASILFLIPTKSKSKLNKNQSSFESILPDFILFRKRRPLLSAICAFLSIFLFSLNYFVEQSPSFDHDSLIIAGNSSKNISTLNTDRLEYLSNRLIIVKKTVQMTPSRWDIDNLDVSDNLAYWRTHDIIPFFDVHINYSGDWTWYNAEMYFPNNGLGPIGTKHDHDFEFIQFVFYRNETVPTYVIYPTFEGLVNHPRVFLKWSEMPKLDNYHYGLLLDSETNAFAENQNLPEPNHNFKPELSESSWSYLTHFEKLQVISSLFMVFLFFFLLLRTELYHHAYFLLILFSCLSAFYPFITLQFDFVGNFCFKVFENAEQPNSESWKSSYSGQIYIDTYGLPYYRDRWTQPFYADIIGI